MSISLTKPAAQRIQQLIRKREGAVAFSFTANESGCSGYSYVMDVVSNIDADAIIIEQHGVNIVSNQKSIDLFNGIEIDYVTEGLNSTFKFRNPQAEAECGCGESFAVSV